MKKFILTVFLLVFTPLSADIEYSGSTDGAIQFIKTLENRYLGTLQSKTVAKSEKYRKFLDALDQYFSIKSIGAFVLGRHRRLFSVEEREQFYEIFKNMLTVVYVDKFQHFGDVRLFDFAAKREDNTRAEEYTVVCKVKTNNQSDVQLKWNLVYGKNGFKVINISVDGISMNVVQRDEFDQQLSQCGDNVGEFLKKLKKKYGKLEGVNIKK